MLLKRVYETKTEDGAPETGSSLPSSVLGRLLGIKILRAKQRQNLSPGFVEGGLAEGWLSMGGGKITFTPVHGHPVVYTIVRAPGIYCCHCEAKLGGVGEGATPEGAARMRKHVTDEHGEAGSLDPNNPAGYRQDNFYACINQGKEVNELSREEAAAMDKKIRDALAAKLGEKHRRK